ncbi:MAG TPA: hypothetical protein VJ804_14875 [Acidimicrobiales bacterium]|nr:hypothetical protein [Acidimicrobiales bacterium]
MKADARRCYVCTDKDCRRDDGFDELVAALRRTGPVREVDCQDLCDGPVAGVPVHGRVEWFEKIRRQRARDAVVALATGRVDEVPKILRSRWARKRSGKVKQ